LPFPVKGARFTIQVPYFNSSGAATDPTTPDTEVAKDGGAFADCIEEVTTISGSDGWGYITLTGDEMNCSMLAVACKASGVLQTSIEVRPQVLRNIHSGTAQAGANGSITLDVGASDASDGAYTGCIVMTTGGTGGGGGSGSQNNQARVITAYNTSTKVASVVPNWEVNPDNTTTFQVLRPQSIGTAVADVRQVNGVTASAQALDANMEGDLIGTVDTSVNGVGDATHFSCSDITEASANHYVGKQVTVKSGTLKGQWWGTVVAYALTNGQGLFTVSPGSPTGEVMVTSDTVCIGS